MQLLYRIIYAAHANGSHHKLALGALERITLPERELWLRLFLKHANLYLSGSKAPDKEFKDFKNHVLHVRDGYWGGAPEKARAWYDHLVEALEGQDWTTAVWCAGVLSHYVTDPVHPFHTAQSEAENNIHRAVEWSMSKSFDDLRRLGEAELEPPAITLDEEPQWLERALCAAATHANGYYEKLIAHYDINRGVVDPPAGLDAVARRMTAELILHATALYGAVLERAFRASNVAPPDVPLALDTVLAALQIPIKWVTKKLVDREEQRLVERIYDELKATGTVEVNLPEDDRTVRDLHRREVLARRQPTDLAQRFVGTPAPRTETVIAWRDRRAAEASARAKRAPSEAASPARAARRLQPPPPPAGPVAALSPSLPERPAAVVAPPPLPPRPVAIVAPPPLPAPSTASVDPPSPLAPPADAAGETAAAPEPAPAAAAPESARNVVTFLDPATSRPDDIGPESLGHRFATTPQRAPAARRAATPRVYLAREDALVDAPSIGPKMAERFAAFGMRIVADFVDADPADTARRLGVRQVTAATIVDWQDQARLVMSVPGLRGTHAQLLVGAGFRRADDVAAAEADALCQRVLAFAATSEGMRVLRNGDPPDIEKIKGWLDAARSVRAA